MNILIIHIFIRMQAIKVFEFGDPEVLQIKTEVEIPEVKENEVRSSDEDVLSR